VELQRNGNIEALLGHPEPSRDARTKLAVELERCDREIAAALKALLTGSVPITEALLWYTDWCRERELILLASGQAEAGGGLDGLAASGPTLRLPPNRS
jgi:hypothetical protein